MTTKNLFRVYNKTTQKYEGTSRKSVWQKPSFAIDVFNAIQTRKKEQVIELHVFPVSDHKVMTVEGLRRYIAECRAYDRSRPRVLTPDQIYRRDQAAKLRKRKALQNRIRVQEEKLNRMRNQLHFI